MVYGRPGAMGLGVTVSGESVFLSHISELRGLPAGRSFVAAAESVVTRAGDVVADMAHLAADARSPGAVCPERCGLRMCTCWSRGSGTGRRCDRPEVSYTELECEAGMVFLLSEEVEGRRRCSGSGVRARQPAFRKRLLDSDITAVLVQSPDRLATAVLRALERLPRARRGDVPVGRVWNIPARSVEFIGRTCRPDCGRRWSRVARRW